LGEAFFGIPKEIKKLRIGLKAITIEVNEFHAGEGFHNGADLQSKLIELRENQLNPLSDKVRDAKEALRAIVYNPAANIWSSAWKQNILTKLEIQYFVIDSILDDYNETMNIFNEALSFEPVY
jgi:hypothetical protein